MQIYLGGGHSSPQIAAQSEQMSGMLKSNSFYLYCVSQPFDDSFSSHPPLPFHSTSKTSVTSLVARKLPKPTFVS